MKDLIKKLNESYDEYIYTEFVINGRTHQNNIVNIRTLRVPYAPTDCFRSIFLHSVKLREYVERVGVVHSYTGKCALDLLPIVFRSENLDLALEEAVNLATHLRVMYDLGYDSIRAAYSGFDSIELLLPSELFGHILPSEHIPRSSELFVRHIKKESSSTVQLDNYKHTSLMRFSNSIDSRTNLHKIILTYDQFTHCNAEDLRKLAKQPANTAVGLPRSEISIIPELREIFEQCLRAVESRRNKQR